MNVLWIFPDKEQCGISIYSRECCDYLRTSVHIDTASPSDWVENRTLFDYKVNNADIIHIQYDTTFYYNKNVNFYRDLTQSIHKPKIVQLHEIYDEFPLVYPRNKIKGPWLFRTLKKFLYDLKHPVQTDFSNHLQKMFFADRIIVQYIFQKRILHSKNPVNCKIESIPLAIKKFNNYSDYSDKDTETLLLGSTGFITPHYNYDLLFSVLEKLDIPWKFIWIGGLRLPEHAPVLHEITLKIDKLGWKDKFIITGFVTEEDQQKHLQSLDIYLALFSHRSSSASLCRAIASHKPVITTSLPLTGEINETGMYDNSGPLHIAAIEPDSIIKGIKRILSDNQYREKLVRSLVHYAEINDISEITRKFVHIYQEFSKQ